MSKGVSLLFHYERHDAIQFIRVDYDRQAELMIAEKLGMPQFDKIMMILCLQIIEMLRGIF
ncbi:hypothetical protein ABNX05_03840 [Lysinibacillus sp. M3]|uniref:Uncharacterized protein n=1 Tax=Lysinibacillus zambalensis TaxID=3160866 RepID=A0ABV1MMJ0_9BACI